MLARTVSLRLVKEYNKPPAVSAIVEPIFSTKTVSPELYERASTKRSVLPIDIP